MGGVMFIMLFTMMMMMMVVAGNSADQLLKAPLRNVMLQYYVLRLHCKVR